MIQLLFALLAAEAALALSLLYLTPARRLSLLTVDRAKWGRRPVMAKTVAGNMLLVVVSSGYNVAKIPHRADEIGQITPRCSPACTSSRPLSWVKNKIVREIVDFAKQHQSVFNNILREIISGDNLFTLERLNMVVSILSKIRDFNELSRKEVDDIIKVCMKQDCISPNDNIRTSAAW